MGAYNKMSKDYTVQKRIYNKSYKKMIQVNQNEVLLDEIFTMIEDILIFMEGVDKEEYETNQYMVGMTNLFREYSVKVWKGVNF